MLQPHGTIYLQRFVSRLTHPLGYLAALLGQSDGAFTTNSIALSFHRKMVFGTIAEVGAVA